MLGLIRLAAEERALRLGVLSLDGRAIAGQFWVIAGGVAQCMRLAFDESYKKLSLGLVLASHMIERFLDPDRVEQIDFGLGADEYKAKWMKDARYYSGFIAFNPRSPLGLFYSAKHIWGRGLKGFFLRVAEKICGSFGG